MAEDKSFNVTDIDYTEYELFNPANKLKLKEAIKEECTNVLLLYFGSFAPIHKGHMKLVCAAKKYLENNSKTDDLIYCGNWFKDKKLNFIGCSISVVNDDVIKWKLGGARVRSTKEANSDPCWMLRSKMVSLIAKKNQPWMFIDTKISTSNFPDVKSIMDYFENGLKEIAPKATTRVLGLAGDDDLHRATRAQLDTPIVCVHNRNAKEDVVSFVDSLDEKYKSLIVLIDGFPDEEISSTLFRSVYPESDKWQSMLDKDVAELHTNLGISYTAEDIVEDASKET